MNKSNLGIKIAAAVFCILIFAGCFIFLGNDRQINTNPSSLVQNVKENPLEFSGSAEVITGKSVTVKFFEQGKVSEMEFGVNGATPVVIVNDKKEETMSQMAGLQWRDYVIVQYDPVTKEAMKISIVR